MRRTDLQDAEGFTLALALMDAVPVLCFGAAMVLIALRFGSLLFIAGACISTLAGCGKVLWKLILGIKKRNVIWLNRYFVPTQCVGFAMILVSFLFCFARIDWGAAAASVLRLPAVIFYTVWLAGMGTMLWYRKNRFDNSAKANWTAQSINCIAEAALLLGVVCR